MRVCCRSVPRARSGKTPELHRDRPRHDPRCRLPASGYIQSPSACAGYTIPPVHARALSSAAPGGWYRLPQYYP